MKQIRVNSDLTIPSLAVGCMRMNTVNEEKAKELIDTALDLGINFF